LASIKALLTQNVGYDEIRLVVAQYAQKAKGENKSFSKHESVTKNKYTVIPES